MSEHVILVIVPGLRPGDVRHMPRLSALAADDAPLSASFPAVSAVVQSCMFTGLLPRDHGIVSGHPSLSVSIDSHPPAERVWETIRGYHPGFRCALIGCDPRATRVSAENKTWISEHRAFSKANGLSANLCIVRLPHLDGPGCVHGPDSKEFAAALAALDAELGDWVDAAQQSNAGDLTLWIVASEYVITEVQRIVRPGVIVAQVVGRHPEFTNITVRSDNQAAHVYLDRASTGAGRQAIFEAIAEDFRQTPGVAEVLAEDGKRRRDVDHPSAGDLVLVAEADTTFLAENDPALAASEPHRAPFVCGTHGAPVELEKQRGIVIASEPGVLLGNAPLADFDIAGLLLRQFGI